MRDWMNAVPCPGAGKPWLLRMRFGEWEKVCPDCAVSLAALEAEDAPRVPFHTVDEATP